MCNQYYFYVVDEDFGPLFIKFSSYFPYTARISVNGHEYAKRQLAMEGIEFEALAHKWLGKLPDPFTQKNHEAGFNYKISILQAEFSRTRVFDRPLSGRHLFEEVIRENIDLGRPSKVSSIFGRRINKRALHLIEWVTYHRTA